MASSMAASAAFLLLGLVSSVLAQSPSSDDCMTQLSPAVPCLDYVQNKANKPPKDCCTGLATLVKNSPVCLCTLARGKLNLGGLAFNQTRGLALPTECKLTGADPSRCDALLGSGSSASATSPAPAMVAGGSSTANGSPSSPAVCVGPSALLLGLCLALTGVYLRY